jgi:hypothetical protein
MERSRVAPGETGEGIVVDDNPESEKAKRGRFRRLLRPMAILTAVGAIVAVAAGTIGLIFQFEPGWAPCIGGANVTFDEAAVYPGMTYVRYLRLVQQLSVPPALVKGGAYSPVPGTVVLPTFNVTNLRDRTIAIFGSVVGVDASGAITKAVPLDFQRPFDEETLSSCSTTLGSSWFIPSLPHGRYRAVLEVYPVNHDGLSRGSRLALFETDSFLS